MDQMLDITSNNGNVVEINNPTKNIFLVRHHYVETIKAQSIVEKIVIGRYIDRKNNKEIH